VPLSHDAHGGEVLAVGSSIREMPMDVLALVCIHSLGLMGVISPYATCAAPTYYGQGYINKGDFFWKFGLTFGVIFFAGLLIIRAAVAETDWHETLRRMVRPH
jgi:di/tricarboxylate transporter